MSTINVTPANHNNETGNYTVVLYYVNYGNTGDAIKTEIVDITNIPNNDDDDKKYVKCDLTG